METAHQANAAQQIAEAQFRARQNDLTDQAVKEFIEEQDGEIAQLFGNVMSPAIETESNGPTPESDVESKPRRMRKRFVNRNGTWLRTKRLKRFHIGEPVYIKNGAGKFEQIGTVNKNGKVPAAYLET